MRILGREPRKKGQRQQEAQFGTWRFRVGILYKSLENVHAAQARTPVRGPPGPTIIILKEIIRFNNNNNNHLNPRPWDGISRQGALLGEGNLPHFVGGIQSAKSLLFSPFPAIPPYVVRTPHPGFTDDREHLPSYNTISSFTKVMRLHKAD